MPRRSRDVTPGAVQASRHSRHDEAGRDALFEDGKRCTVKDPFASSDEDIDFKPPAQGECGERAMAISEPEEETNAEMGREGREKAGTDSSFSDGYDDEYQKVHVDDEEEEEEEEEDDDSLSSCRRNAENPDKGRGDMFGEEGRFSKSDDQCDDHDKLEKGNMEKPDGEKVEEGEGLQHGIDQTFYTHDTLVTQNSQGPEIEKDNREKYNAGTETNLLSTGPVLPVTPPKNDEGLQEPNQRPGTLPSTVSLLPCSLDHFKEAYKSSSSSENAKTDIVWKAMKYAYENSRDAGFMEFMKSVVAKLDESFDVVADVGVKDIVEGQSTKATLFHERAPAFVEGYYRAPKKSRKEFLENTVLTLRGEGFRFLEEAPAGGGYQEMDLNSSCSILRKRILHIRKSRPPTATTAAATQDAASSTTIGTGIGTGAQDAAGHLADAESVMGAHVPGVMDILPGWTKSHPANLSYRQKLASILDEFESATRGERTAIVTKLFGDLQREGYRLLERSSPSEFYTVLESQKAIEKVRRNLKDMVIRKRKREGGRDD